MYSLRLRQRQSFLQDTDFYFPMIGNDSLLVA